MSQTLLKLKADMLEAMKAKDVSRLNVIRFLLSEIKNKEIALRDKNTPLDEAEVINVILKEKKKRQEALAIYIKNGRSDLSENEEKELQVIETYLPKQLSEEEIKATIASEINKLSDSEKNFASAIKIIMPMLKGKADGKLVVDIVKELL